MFIRRFGGFWLVLGLGLVSILTPGRSEAEVLAQSTFDTDSDGWVVKDLAYTSPGAPPVPLGTFNPTYHGTGGNPGGYLSLSDPTGNTWFWNAPSKFLGNKQAAYGGTLSFDLAVTGAGTPFDEEDVILVGGGLTLVFTLPARPGTTFTSYHVPLTEAGWKRNTRAGVAATPSEMTTVLGALTNIYIRGEYLLSLDDVGSIDNIVLDAPGAVCDIQLGQSSFQNGEQISIQVFRLGNQKLTPLAIEFKLWLEVPGPVAVGLGQSGADGSFVLPAGFNQNFGPFNLFAVAPTMPRGSYAFNCRMLNPVTGALMAEDINSFEIH